MASILRITRDCTRKGVEVWVDGDPTPIYFGPDIVSKWETILGYPVEQLNILNPPLALLTRLDEVIAAREAIKVLARKLAVFDEVRSTVEAQIAVQFDKARAYIETHPNVTLTQIRNAVLSKLQNLFTGDVV